MLFFWANSKIATTDQDCGLPKAATGRRLRQQRLREKTAPMGGFSNGQTLNG
jgi:hypothetical protein